ncbi:MAG: DUF4147 domain-containing protein [Thermoplasmata archaeon]
MIGQFPWDPFPPGVPLPQGPDPLAALAYRGAVEGADAYRGVREALRSEHGILRIGNRFVRSGRYREVAFVALGNAAGAMARAAIDALGEEVTAGFAAGPPEALAEVPFPTVPLSPGVPVSAASEEVVRNLAEIGETLDDRHLLLLLLSPGALGALLRPPPGVTAEELSSLLAEAQARGASGDEVARIARTIGEGGVGGRVAAFVGSADVATMIVDRGEGARRLGGGPMIPLSAAERAEARALVGRLGLALPSPLASRLAPGEGETGSLPIHRPVYVARPADALTGAGDALVHRKWRVRLGALDLPGGPEEAADAFVAAVEGILRREPPPESDRSRGIAVVAAARLGQIEGADAGPALTRFLGRVRERFSPPARSVALFRTAGPIGSSAFPGAAVVGAPENASFAEMPGVARAIPMEAAVTDVGYLALALAPAEPYGGPAGPDRR